jgi:hypothetical protein
MLPQDDTQAALDRIAQTIGQIQQENAAFQQLDRTQLTHEYSDRLLKSHPANQILKLPQERFAKTIRSMMTWGMLYGLIADFTPEQMQAFDEAVENR